MADIGSLVVKLAAETAEFQADLGKSARLLDKHANEMKASLQSVANVAKSAFALAVGVTSVAAIKEFVLQTMEAAAALQGLSEQTGASVEALSGFQAVATISHTTLENIGGSLAKLAKGMAGVDDETAGATKALQFLGVDARDTAGNLRDPAEVMNDIALKLAQFEDGAGKTAIAMELFGKSGAGMLQKNVIAIHAARIALALCKDSVTGLGDAAWLALLNSLPFEAAGQKVDRAKLLASHKEAWRQAAASPDDPMTRILAARDPVERVRLALAADELPEGELTTIVTDALSALPEGRRHALAEWLFESDAVGRLSVIAADEAAHAYRELACLQEVHEQVTPNGQRHRAWKRIQKRLGVLQPDSPSSDRVANLLTALFSSGRLDEETDIDKVLDSFLDTRRQLAAEAV